MHRMTRWMHTKAIGCEQRHPAAATCRDAASITLSPSPPAAALLFSRQAGLLIFTGVSAPVAPSERRHVYARIVKI